jgi:hypothetical protein
MYGFIGVILSAAILCLSSYANADVFNRIGIDYDVPTIEAEKVGKEMTDPDILKWQRYAESREDLKESMTKQIDEQTYSGAIYIPDKDKDRNTPKLLDLQYKSPAKADLLKHMDTIAHLKMIISYSQMADLERNINTPQMALRRSSQLECIMRDIEDAPKDLPSKIEFCKKQSPYGHLRLPGSDSYIANGGFYLINTVLGKLKVNDNEVKELIKFSGDTQIAKTIYKREEPDTSIRNLLIEKRTALLGQLNQILESYIKEKVLDEEVLKKLSVPGSPLTEQQLRNIAMFDTNERQKIFHSIASSLAYIHVSMQYERMIALLNQGLEYPGIQPEYKMILEEHKGFLKAELEGLINERKLLEDYANKLDFLDESFNQKRLKLIKVINDGQ